MALVQARFHGYAVAGDPSKLTHGDYYAGKGIGHAILQTSEGQVAVFNTHTCANYSHRYEGAYCLHDLVCNHCEHLFTTSFWNSKSTW